MVLKTGKTFQSLISLLTLIKMILILNALGVGKRLQMLLGLQKEKTQHIITGNNLIAHLYHLTKNLLMINFGY